MVISDPIDGGSNPKRIPGSVMEFSTVVANTGDGSPDANSVIVIDHIDSSTFA
jgi:hypothetical protein